MQYPQKKVNYTHNITHVMILHFIHFLLLMYIKLPYFNYL